MSRILIVEDEAAIAELEKDYLELSGFEVEVANDGNTGLDAANIIGYGDIGGLIGFSVFNTKVEYSYVRSFYNKKAEDIDNVNYDHSIQFDQDDELRSLGLAIEDMRLSLINQEEFRNQMYQNISHDFKTPLTVIKSYVEAVEDNKNGAD